MGINIGVCEMEAKNAVCRSDKNDFVKVIVDDPSQFADAAEIDEFVSLEDAKDIFSDFEEFIKRNRINEESDAIYIEKVKKAEKVFEECMADLRNSDLRYKRSTLVGSSLTDLMIPRKRER